MVTRLQSPLVDKLSTAAFTLFCHSIVIWKSGGSKTDTAMNRHVDSIAAGRYVQEVLEVPIAAGRYVQEVLEVPIVFVFVGDTI
jgi:hypothetical protein